ncbi:MAG: glycosyltransferase [Nostoc sp. DedVER02]|uniref:glycosyltransferase n=1 Tax=unclassified Nostoc TaxID=2593658 RepID=UPI002AD2127F|nr:MULTISPECIES: glycosyltransferase [unclassified Nostoc]MDZ7988007.1 glycosyltransferase [Nostoc sp. DedVER02]MDZ8114932.1 glycosyltransferase [Nostoc sp. DedVER01b]
MQKSRDRYHLWFPDLFNAKGGIQRYSSFCLQAFQSLYPNFDYDIFIKHDTKVPSNSSNLCFHAIGNWPLSLRTPAFAAYLISLGCLHRPSLVFSSHLNFSVAAYRLRQLTGTPYWAVGHGIDAWNIQNPALQTALHHADRVLTGSHYTRDRLLKEQNLDPDKVVVLPNTFDADDFQIAPKPDSLLKRYGLKPEQPIILTVARLAKSEQYKGYDKILAALPQIRQAIPNIHYVLVGKGDDQSRIEQLISQYQLQDCVTLTGFVSDEELSSHYHLCDLFAMPSKAEGFGIVYLEALACGKPTLGGNQDGAQDALCHGELGALVDPDDIEAIAKTIIQILQRTYSNPLIYQPEALREKVIKQFGFEQFQKTLGNYLEQYFTSI